jgi:hypothetical protein
MSQTVYPALTNPKSVLTPSDTPANSWTFVRVGGVPTPGTIPVGGLKGFRRETTWDVKKGKGTQGATLTLTTTPPIKGTVTLQLVTQQDFANWTDFVDNVLSTDPTKQQETGLSWYYPGHLSIGLTQVVVCYFTGPEYQGKGMYHASFEVIEWANPPAKSVVQTVSRVSADLPTKDQPSLVDQTKLAESRALLAQLAAISQGNQNPGGET